MAMVMHPAAVVDEVVAEDAVVASVMALPILVRPEMPPLLILPLL